MVWIVIEKQISWNYWNPGEEGINSFDISFNLCKDKTSALNLAFSLYKNSCYNKDADKLVFSSSGEYIIEDKNYQEIHKIWCKDVDYDTSVYIRGDS